MTGNEAGDFAATLVYAAGLIVVFTVLITGALTVWDRVTRRRVR